MTPTTLATPHRQWIGGDWCDAHAGNDCPVISPATEDVVTTVPFGDASDARSALDAAHDALPAWAGRTAYDRGAILRRTADIIGTHADQIAALTVAETGKPIPQARGEVLVAAQLFDWYAEEGKRLYGRTVPTRHGSRRSQVVHSPMGVVGVITAWNFPAYNPARAWAAALAAGCTVVGRPSELTPLTAMALAAAFEAAGGPPGTLNLINGDPHAMAQAMLDDERCRKIGFTGSTRVGRILMDGASRTFTRLGLELGGNAPVVICDDVDPVAMAKGAVVAKMRNAGQVCVAPQRFYVQRSIFDDFVAAAADHANGIKLGNGSDDGVQMGPIITRSHQQRVATLVQELADQGATIAAGGEVPADHDRGFFYAPTVVHFDRGTPAAASQEAFGPVMMLTPFDAIDEAIERANATEYGLAAYVWTKDIERAARLSEGLDFGMVGVNDWAPQSTELPFAPRKASGFGIEAGAEGLLDYVDSKAITYGGLQGWYRP